VDNVNKKLKITPPLCVDDINRSHIIETINNGKGQHICRFKNWKIKNAIYMLFFIVSNKDGGVICHISDFFRIWLRRWLSWILHVLLVGYFHFRDI
jgi:hypothetical protein